MFYLKYRPRNIEEIDNSRVRNIIKKILTANELPHALLFTGPKGTGKTSTARIFAKAVNCLNNKFNGKSLLIEPCNKCVNCLSINVSSSMDVMEMDAASNRGIEEIKSLIKETAYLPMATKYRVFIIDEAHMITPDGFNALLKTLEEPPDTVIFILATTNPEKLPKTIISRCVKINFGKAQKEDILSMLKRIADNEKISYPKNLYELINSHAEGSFRDAAKILEELSMQKIITIAEAETFLGISGKNDLLEIVATGDLKKTFSWVDEFSKNGGDFKNLIEDLLEQLRNHLLMKKGMEFEDLPQSPLTTRQIVILIKLLMEAYQNLRLSPIESLPLEIALVEFYNLSKN